MTQDEHLNAIDNAARALASALAAASQDGIPPVVLVPHLIQVVQSTGLLEGVDTSSLPFALG